MRNRDNNIVQAIYALRHKFMIIGLTGRTGSGCTTIANLLSNSEGFVHLNPPLPSLKPGGVSNDERKYRILYNYLKHIWATENIEFKPIKASEIIFFYVLLDGYEAFKKSFSSFSHMKKDTHLSALYQDLEARLDKDIKEEFETLSSSANAININLKSDIEQLDESILNIINTFIFDILPKFYVKVNDVVKEQLNRKMYKEMQQWGNNIRRYGTAKVGDETSQVAPSELASKINRIIKVLRKINKKDDKATFVIIDALRNPYEVFYFRERYSAFYLMSVNTEEKYRKHNLQEAYYRKDDIETLDGEEYPEKSKDIITSFYTQDIQKCIEISDIHIVHNNMNVDLNTDLKRQIVQFIALMLHPGLVPPSPEERLMQIANTAKLNSGCVSRQVGAVVTDKNFSLKSIGWNTVPQGQTPCSLRDFHDLYLLNDKSAFSQYELEQDEFREVVKDFKLKYDKARVENLLNDYGLPLPYCFKNLYTVVKNGEKNQVHTRSLHAEENAFLQLAKYGSHGIEGGRLFTTASPCELCSKKAYQLGIKDIYYIDIYPGISFDHVLNSGVNIPNLHLFKGAIGHAYQRLYNPFLPLKDEIEYLTEVEIKYVPKQEQKINQKQIVSEPKQVDMFDEEQGEKIKSSK